MTTVTVDAATGYIEDIDGDLPPERALTIRPAEAVGLARAAAPGDMIDLAAKMATALRDIVEKQHLFAVISGKKYPTVEAWATIARMDNVVAREGEAAPIRHEDGSYEATVELIRLGDLAVVGRGSALCGAPDDRPWNGRAEYARRSMAVTRATSRAFRQHYSWIMALAGYEVTPAEEMPHQNEDRAGSSTPSAAMPSAAGGGSLIGTAEAGAAPADGELRQNPEGVEFGFVIRDGRTRVRVVVEDEETALQAKGAELIGKRVQAWGTLELVPWQKDGKAMPPYRLLHATRLRVDGGLDLPVEDDAQAELDAIAANLP